MNPKELEKKYQRNKDKFYKYITFIKQNMEADLYNIINPTLIINPYISRFPLNFFLQDYINKSKLILFIKNTGKFYIKQFYLFFSYIVSFCIYKIYYKPKDFNHKEDYIGIDIFFLVDNIIKDNRFNENYFKTLYPVLDKKNKKYIFIPRLYGANKNPIKLIKLFKIFNKDNRNFLFEFELLSITDLFKIFIMFLLYPFKTLRLLQKEVNDNNVLFNQELIKDISSLGIEAFSRYIYGKNLAKFNNIYKIYSWSEFQVIERSFNYAIRKNNVQINLIACQFYLNYEICFNTYIDDVDYEMYSSPHKVLVNGKYYLLQREKVKYSLGVSLRYKDIFYFKNIVNEKNILLIGSYIEKDTSYMLQSIKSFNNIVFKNHPALAIEKFSKFLNDNIVISNKNLYKLFKTTELVIGTAFTGTIVEAVACGISVIIIASQDNLTVNPLVDYGKGKIWDIAFSEDDVKKLYNKLLEYRKNNKNEIQEIAEWYKNNFFIEPTEENIIKAFDLNGEICR